MIGCRDCDGRTVIALVLACRLPNRVPAIPLAQIQMRAEREGNQPADWSLSAVFVRSFPGCFKATGGALGYYPTFPAGPQ